MNASDKLDQIAPAMVAALAKIRNPRTDSKARVQTKQGGTYEYKYLSLPALCEHVRGAFEHVGLAFTQEVVDVEGGTGVVTRIWHISGQWVEMGPLVLRGGAGAQEQGSLTTYARRYSLAAAVGLAADEDDDSKRASEPRRQSSGADNGPPPPNGSAVSSAPEPSSPGEVGTAPGESEVTSSGKDEPAGGEKGKALHPPVPDRDDALTEARDAFGHGSDGRSLGPRVTDARIVAAARMEHECSSVDELSAEDLRALATKKRELAGAK